MLDQSEAKQIAAMLAAIGEPTRMLILHRLAEGSSHVGRLAETVGVPMVNMSHHLGVMRLAGLIQDAKEGRRVYYSLHPEVFSPDGPPDALGTLQIGSFRLVLVKPSANGDGKKRKKSDE
jgi:DNA-binding transcriptional ArsR family regulator